MEQPLRVERVQQRRGRSRPSLARGRGRARPLARRRQAAFSDEAQRVAQLSRGFSIGVRAGSTCSRRCSKFGGRRAARPALQGLVGREARADGRDLEQDARLAEVDRLEVEAVDDRGGRAAGLDHALAPRLVLLGSRSPRDVVDGSCAWCPALVGLVVDVRAAAILSSHLVSLIAAPLELEGALEELAARLWIARVGAHAVEPLDPVLHWESRDARRSRLVAGGDDRELEAEALGIREGQAPVTARDGDVLARSRSSQGSSALSEPTRNTTRWTIPAPARRLRPGTRT